MKYLCLAYGDQKKMEALSKSEFEALVAMCRVHDEELRKSGRLVLVESLEWGTSTVRPRNGKVVVTDGPFVETKEQVGGLFIIEAADLDEAIRVASLHPAAHLGERLGWGIEVRPISDGCHQ
ncbi:MAG: hypothetical protein EYC70_06910 [Planctomycetota bacterium]|nr:MAG: hypothetical protein EYC70_06910 [Planctomycetota bacterium]